MKIYGITTIKANGNSKCVILPYRLFKDTDLKLKDDLIVMYDEEKDEIILKKQ